MSILFFQKTYRAIVQVRVQKIKYLCNQKGNVSFMGLVEFATNRRWYTPFSLKAPYHYITNFHIKIIPSSTFMTLLIYQLVCPLFSQLLQYHQCLHFLNVNGYSFLTYVYLALPLLTFKFTLQFLITKAYSILHLHVKLLHQTYQITTEFFLYFMLNLKKKRLWEMLHIGNDT